MDLLAGLVIGLCLGGMAGHWLGKKEGRHEVKTRLDMLLLLNKHGDIPAQERLNGTLANLRSWREGLR
jgi:hypothetical protein